MRLEVFTSPHLRISEPGTGNPGFTRRTQPHRREQEGESTTEDLAGRGVVFTATGSSHPTVWPRAQQSQAHLGRDVLICSLGRAGMTSTVEPLVFIPGRLSSRQSLKTPKTVVW